MKTSKYQKILAKSRKKELHLTRESLNNVVSLLGGISDSLEGEIARFSDEKGILRKEQLQAMKAKIDHDLDTFETQYTQIVTKGVKDSAEVIIERNGEIFLEVEGTTKFIDVLQDDIIRQALVLEEKDGLILSDRIWRMTQEAKADITNRIQQGMLLGESHVKVAKDIRQYVKGGGLKYKSERLAFTEMAKAYKQADEKTVQIMRTNSAFMWYEKWELSPRHQKPDVCDILASQNVDGEGPGIYKRAPNRHPGCFCYIYPVYRPKRQPGDYPTISNIKPQTEDLDNSQRKLAKELTI